MFERVAPLRSISLKVWGSGLAAVALVPADWRDPADPLCIEMLYGNEVLRRKDSSGRRLYLSQEFDRRSGHHESRLVTTPHPGIKPLVREEVHDVATGDSVGLSKLAFAEHIAEGQEPFHDVSFEGFRKTFEVIEEATARIAKPASSR
jgi:hypothetical protein